MPKICVTPFAQTGGMASFRIKFQAGLAARGIDVTYDFSDSFDALLVIAGTRFLLDLNSVRRKGIRIVQRLDGVNWVQRARRTSLRYHLRAEYGNFMLSFIRRRFADRIIYQSDFIRKWWEDWRGIAPAPASVILNGVDLNIYSPIGEHERPAARFRMLLLEGSLAEGLNSGLYHAVAVAEKMSEKYPLEIVVAGKVDEATKHNLKSKVPVKFLGMIPREQIPQLARSSHVMYCAEVNPPCPNSVIEALACGLPVIGFDSGSLKELVSEEAGCIAPYGANPWKLETPNISALASLAGTVFEKQDSFRAGARKRAESIFGLDRMIESYLQVLLG